MTAIRLTGGALRVQTITRLDMLRSAVAGLRRDGAGAGASVALVPTMGALHEGHLALIRAARGQADHVVASIFVNPRQFGAGEDLDAYPRQMDRDAALLEAEGVALLWAPASEEVYPAGYATNVSVSGVSAGLCGADRPGHFDGVATVVCKLFNQVRPDMAFFGEKDWQQLAVIRRMARDLDLTQPEAGAIHAVPTVREADGLAMSSRNAYLTPDRRAQAAALPRAMREAAAAIDSGSAVAETLDRLRGDLVAGGFDSVDYAELRDAATLERVGQREDAARLFVAARIGGTRLIDNIGL
jgi:pantoate--beta-alanine ligase